MSADLENYLKQVEGLEKQKQGIIEKILEQRRALDAQLEKLGYSENRGSAKKGGRPKGKKDTQKRTSKKGKAES